MTLAEGKRRGPVTVAMVAVAAGVLGIVLGASGQSARPGERDVAAAGGGFAVRHPPEWRQTRSVPRIPGLPALGEGSVYLTADGGRAGFFAALRRGDLSAAIPPALAARLGSSGVVRSVARLHGDTEAYRWSSNRVGSARVELFAVPLSGGTILAGCAARQDARRDALPTCRRIVADLQPQGSPTGEIQPTPLFVAALRRTIGTARDALRRGGERLRAARTAGGQASAALAVARSLRAATGELAATSPNASAAGWHRQTTAALGTIGRGFVVLARGFRTRDRATVTAAQETIREGERRLAGALTALSAIGFGDADRRTA